MSDSPGIAGIEYPVRPMLAVPALRLPAGQPGDWAAEPKLDGFRCISLRSLDTVALQSRQHRSLTRYFPEIADAVAELGVDVVLDGVIWGPRWRVQEVADRPPEVRPPVLWTAYLRLVHDGRRPRSWVQRVASHAPDQRRFPAPFGPRMTQRSSIRSHGQSSPPPHADRSCFSFRLSRQVAPRLWLGGQPEMAAGRANFQIARPASAGGRSGSSS